jgi:hypothetical protein
MPTPYTFARASDKTIIDFFQAIHIKDRPDMPNVTINDYLHFPLPAEGGLPPKFANIVGSSSHIVRTVAYSISATQFSVEYIRSGESTFVDKIIYNLGDFLEQAALENFFACLERYFNAAIPVSLTQGAQGALEQSQAILNRVSEAAASIAEQTAKRQSEIDRQLDTLRSENALSLEQSRSELQAGYDGKLATLDEREKLIAEREATLDDRQNTHVRREIHDKMAGLPAEIMEAGLLRHSHQSFFTMIMVAILVAGGLAALAVVTGMQLSRDLPANQLLFLEVTRVLLGLGAGAAFWFTIRQSANRYQQVARWEQQLNTFRLDVERASFLIEGDLEARKLGDSGLPEVMLQSFSRGLFTNDNSEPQDDTVGSAIVHLLSRPASLKIGPAGAEATFDKAGLKQSGKEIEAKG